MKRNSSIPLACLTDERLAALVATLLLQPEAAGEDMSAHAHRRFREAIANAIADECGGEVQIEKDQVVIYENDSLPAGGGAWTTPPLMVIPAQAKNIIADACSAVARGDDGDLFISQESIRSINALSALAGTGPMLLDGQHQHGVIVNGCPREEWDENLEYGDWVDSTLQQQYAQIRESILDTQQDATSAPEPGGS